MALAERPTLTLEEREAVLARLAAKLDDLDDAGPLGPDGRQERFRSAERERSPDRAWHSLGIELEEVPEVSPIGDAGRDALARMFELLERHRPAWQRDALCIEYAETVTWFPARGESVRPAKDVCARCLVAEECHAYALEIDAAAGIWAGTSARSRQRDAA